MRTVARMRAVLANSLRTMMPTRNVPTAPIPECHRIPGESSPDSLRGNLGSVCRLLLQSYSNSYVPLCI